MRYYSGFDESFYYAYTHGKGGFAGKRSVEADKLTNCVASPEQIEAVDLQKPGV